jgi:hypothetical protein
LSSDDVLPFEMDGSIGHGDWPDPLDGTEGAVGGGDHTLFVEDLRTAFPETPLQQGVAEDHIAAMVGAIQLLAEKGESALEPTSKAHGPDRRASGLPKQRRITMRKRMIAKLAVAMAMLLSLAGLANAGMLPHRIQSAVDQVLGINADDQGADDQGEDANDQGEDVSLDGDEVEHGGLVGADLDADENDAADENSDTDENEDAVVSDDADDQGENADDQGEVSQSEDADQGDDSQSAGDDQGDASQSAGDDQGNDGAAGSDQ